MYLDAKPTIIAKAIETNYPYWNRFVYHCPSRHNVVVGTRRLYIKRPFKPFPVIILDPILALLVRRKPALHLLSLKAR